MTNWPAGPPKPTPAADTAAAITFLQHWDPGGPWLLTAINPRRGEGIETESFDPGDPRTDDVARARAWVARWQGKRNLYFHVNRPQPGLMSKARKEHIVVALAIHADVDPRPGYDRDEERGRILAMLRAYDPPPSVIIDSGNGYGGFWRIPPDPDTGGIERRSKFISKNLLGADPAGSIDHLMRLPGTINIPTLAKLAKGYSSVPTVARVVEADWSWLHSPVRFPEPARVLATSPAEVLPERFVADAEQYPGAGYIAYEDEERWRAEADRRKAEAERQAAVTKIENAIQRVMTAPVGERNNVLSAAAFTCGGSIEASGMNADAVLGRLVEAVSGPGRNLRKDWATARCQFRAGMAQPMAPLPPLVPDPRIQAAYRTAGRLQRQGATLEQYMLALHLDNALRGPHKLAPEIIDKIAHRFLVQVS